MSRIIRKISLKIGLLLMAGIALAACSNFEEDDISKFNQSNMDGLNVAYIIDMAGDYSGEWTLNGKKVDADPANSFFSLSVDRQYFFNFNTFPFQALASQFFHQENLTNGIPKITTVPSLGVQLENEELLLYKTIFFDDSFLNDGYSLENAKEDKSTRMLAATELDCVGYSRSLVYFELEPYENYSYLRYPYALSFPDGEYFAVVLDVVPSKSTVTIDYSTRTMTFVCNIPQIELYDSDGKKTIVEQKPELILSFTSTNKTKTTGNGD